MGKTNRHKIIKDIVISSEIASQDTLLTLLINRGVEVTQATLSRDIKELKIVKAPNPNGDYIYQYTDMNNQTEENLSLVVFGFVSIDFSGQLAVIKTRPGYAMGIAGEIDNKASDTILGTVAGDDTILLIPRENVKRDEVLKALRQFIPNI